MNGRVRHNAGAGRSLRRAALQRKADWKRSDEVSFVMIDALKEPKTGLVCLFTDLTSSMGGFSNCFEDFGLRCTAAQGLKSCTGDTAHGEEQHSIKLSITTLCCCGPGFGGDKRPLGGAVESLSLTEHTELRS